jgi:DNA-binding response OmpR family regulator
LPEIRGTDVADLLVQYTDAPILVVSGLIDEGAKRRLQRAGVRDYLDKPFKMADLLLTVERMLKERDQR